VISSRPVLLVLVSVELAAVFVRTASGENPESYLLPWQVIAEKVTSSEMFCVHPSESSPTGKDDQSSHGADGAGSGANYVFASDQTIIFELNRETVIGLMPQKVKTQIFRWTESSWQENGEVLSDLLDNRITLGQRITEQGFFKLVFALVGNGAQEHRFTAYAIVCSNWKKNVLAFCRMVKNEIETHPDPQLLRSSLAVSHFDQAMDLVSKSRCLSWECLQALASSVQSYTAFKAGMCPDFIVGLNKIRIKRFPGAPECLFVIHVPPDYIASRKWPLYFQATYGGQDEYHAGMIDIWWCTLTVDDDQFKEYKILLELLENKLNIDLNRVYGYGYCGASVPIVNFALHRPDYWAEVNIDTVVTGYELAGNAINLKLNCVLFAHDRHEPFFRSRYDFLINYLKYEECPSLLEGTVDVTKSVPTSVLNRRPMRVRLTTDSLRAAKVHWVQVDGREDENFLGTIDVSVNGQTISIKTNNIDAYTLNLTQAPVDMTVPITIIENGKPLTKATSPLFVRRAKKYETATLVKNSRSCGPVKDVFSEPFVVVYGSGGENRDYVKQSETLARALAHGAPCLTDTELTETMATKHNLVLIGNSMTNRWLSRIEDQMPVQLEDGRIIAKDLTFEGKDIGYSVIYPNPLNSENYAAVFSAGSLAAIKQMCELQNDLAASDVSVFEISEAGQVKWKIRENFNTVWKWHDHWDKVLAVVERRHPRWQWHSWIAGSARRQMKADIVVLSDCFRSSDMMSAGSIRFRDLYQNVDNVWLVKLVLSGKSLRTLLMAPFNDLTLKKDSVPLVIDGINRSTNMRDGRDGILAMNKLELDKKYSVLISPDLIWRTLRADLTEFQITDDTYLVPIVEQCLSGERNIDSELDSMEHNVF